MLSGLHIADHSWVLDEAIFRFVLVLYIIVYLLYFFFFSHSYGHIAFKWEVVGVKALATLCNSLLV